MRKKLLSMLALLCLTVSGAWAQNPGWVRDVDTWDDDTKTLTVEHRGLENDAYRGVSDIEHVIIIYVPGIGNYAFYQCSNLKSVTISEDIGDIGAYAFAQCSNLTSVTIGEGTNIIRDQAFAGTALTSITIPNSVTSIGNGAFGMCTNLTSVTIGNSVESIGDAAFYGCTGLTSVTNYAVTPQNIENNYVFEGVTLSGCTLYVPEESIDLYQDAEVWKDFGTQSAIPAAYDVTANLANGAYWATFYSNLGNYQAPDGTQVFTVHLEGTGITMNEVGDRIAKSGEGVVLKKTTTGNFTMTLTETVPAGDFSSNNLDGTMTQINTTGANDYYVLGGKNGAGFYKLSNTSGTIGANKAYLTYSGGGAAPAREFFLFDEATGIEMPTVEDNGADAVVYDLQGRRVVNPTKGLYIVNGKKVFINK